MLGYLDHEHPYKLNTDASVVGVGDVLSQLWDGEEWVISYFRKTMLPLKKKYCVTRKELPVVIKAIKHFRPHLYG